MKNSFETTKKETSENAEQHFLDLSEETSFEEVKNASEINLAIFQKDILPRIKAEDLEVIRKEINWIMKYLSGIYKFLEILEKSDSTNDEFKDNIPFYKTKLSSIIEIFKKFADQDDSDITKNIDSLISSFELAHVFPIALFSGQENPENLSEEFPKLGE